MFRARERTIGQQEAADRLESRTGSAAFPRLALCFGFVASGESVGWHGDEVQPLGRG